MSQSYDIFKKLKYEYFPWICNEATRAKALERLESLTREHRDDSTYDAVAKTLPSLLAISPAVAASSSVRY